MLLYCVVEEKEHLSQVFIFVKYNPAKCAETFVSFFLKKSMEFNINAEDKACPNSAEYPPVLNTVSLNNIGENRPLTGTFGILAVYGLSTNNASINVLVSYFSPPLTIKPPSFAALLIPGSVFNAPN